MINFTIVDSTIYPSFIEFVVTFTKDNDKISWDARLQSDGSDDNTQAVISKYLQDYINTKNLTGSQGSFNDDGSVINPIARSTVLKVI